ncbi:MAG: hypothetical protein JW991_02720 [Candidatus Pacebacteria bacterium]|nr:hypothetical protein [Candidatus Paceibacterota bacterium]
MSKRRRIIITALLLSSGLAAIPTEIVVYRYWAIFGLSLLALLLSGWSLRENLNGIEWLTVLILPFLFTGGVGFFYFLLSSAWTARLPVIVLFALGIYVLLLTENIFSVASVRNIQLFRSAQATGFLLTLLTAFFLFDTVFSFRLSPWLNFLVCFPLGFLLFFQGLWSVVLREKFSPRILYLGLVLALVLAEIALGISFWPLAVSTSSLFLITALYVLLGLVQGNLQERLFKNTIKEYLWVGMTVLLTVLLTTRWGR